MARALDRRSLIIVTALWLGAIAVGMKWLLDYQFAPGAEAHAPETWPGGEQVLLHTDVPTIVMIAHPHCSCTRASIGELSRLMTRLQGQVRGYVVFMVPKGAGDSWRKTGLWESASIIGGIRVVSDEGGALSARFGAKTSGQTYLFGRDGRLLFSGGITPSRSHYGDSVGRQQIVSLVTSMNSHEGKAAGSAVYGCALSENNQGS